MKKLAAGSLAALALLAIVFATARADEPTLGSPGSPDCRGKTAAFLAQAAKNGNVGDALHAMGFAGFASTTPLTVQELHQFVDAFCAGGGVGSP